MTGSIRTENPPAATVRAFKEWAAIVHALLSGEQIVDIRKGGLREDGRHFDIQADRLWLYPTAEHQRPELLKPAYRHWTDLAPGSVVGQPITIAGWADIVGAATITEPEELAGIDSKLIWALAYASTRLKWKRRDPLWVLALRVHRLADPITVPWDDRFGGCTSWVSLDGLPEDPTTVASEPALSDTAFATKLAGVASSLPGGLSMR